MEDQLTGSLKKILPVPVEPLELKTGEDFKEWRKRIKDYEIVEFNNFIGKIIKDKRKELNIAPTNIASALSITYNTYYNYENGQINIPPQNLFKIAGFLNISLDECKELYFSLKRYKDNFDYFNKKKI